MQSKSCDECIAAMALVKGELLARIACANCQQAKEALSEATEQQGKLIKRRRLGLRCVLCGKWCWTTTGLAVHLHGHGFWENN